MKKIMIILVVILGFLFPGIGFAEENSTPSGIPFSTLEDFVDNYMGDYIGKTAAGASIVIAKDGEILFSKGYGYADIENKIKMNSKTTILE